MHTLLLEDVEWAARECQRQDSGAMSVYNLTLAVQYARFEWTANRQKWPETPTVTVKLVRTLAVLVDPRNKGFRRVPVTINGIVAGVAPENIERVVGGLCYSGLGAAEFFQEFEEIHPFEDGNGRVGAILYNWRNGSLWALQTAPEFQRR